MAINASQGVLALGVLTLLFGGDIVTLFSGTGVLLLCPAICFPLRPLIFMERLVLLKG